MRDIAVGWVIATISCKTLPWGGKDGKMKGLEAGRAECPGRD